MKYIILFSFAFISFANSVQKFNNWDNLTGDWGGLRNTLSDNGFDLESRYLFELWSLPFQKNEKRTSFYIQNIDIDFLFDFEKLFGIKGASLLFDLQGINGENPNVMVVASLQGVSNIEAWNNFLIYELWYKQTLLDDKLSILAGLFDLNSEFDVMYTKSNFLTPADGIGTDLALTGKLGPSIFPLTSLALNLKYDFTDNFNFSLAFFDGMPGDINNLKGTHIVLKNTDGLLVIGESKLFPTIFTNGDKGPFLKFGFWYYTDRYTHIVSGIKQWGIYASAEKSIFREKGNRNQGLDASIRIGYSDPKTNFTDIFFALSFQYKGLITNRDDDYCGIALAYSELTLFFHERFSKEVFADHHKDVSIEFFYKLRTMNFLFFQPVINYFFSPALNTGSHEYITAGIRMYVQI